MLTRIHRTVSRISVALESGSQISDSLRLELGNAINNVERLLDNTPAKDSCHRCTCQWGSGGPLRGLPLENVMTSRMQEN